MSRRGALVTAVVGLLGLLGCAPALPRPMSAADLARLDSGAALVAYLGQRDASPAVCDPRSGGPHMARFDRDTSAALVRALEDGQIDPQIWRRCADAVVDGGSREEVVSLIDAAADGYRALATDRALETSPALQARLAVLQAGYIERPTGKDRDPATTAQGFDELRRAFFQGRFGPVAARFVGELLSVVDLERGRYGGRPVDRAAIDDIAARRDETLLRRFADRLPAPELRDEARRRLIRLAIAASPFDEVKAQAEEVEARVMREGVNRISLAQQPAARATLDAKKLPARNVLVRQDVPHQTAALFGYSNGGTLSVVPAVSLAGALWVDVAGLSRPITICQAPRRFDPTPCIAAGDVTIENPFAVADPDGTFHFRDRVSEVEAVGATGAKNWFPLPIAVGGHRLSSFGWPLRFERPADLVLSPGFGRGPDLKVAVSRVDPTVLAFTVTNGGSIYRAVVEKSDLPAFHVISRGAAGAPGLDGMAGSDGMAGFDGSSASCPSMSGGDGTRGGDGGNGTDGTNGGDGSDGGDIQVDVDCGVLACGADDVNLLLRAIVSQGGAGGAGGAGGRGGRGGRGGSGGSGTTCTDSTTGESSSLSGGNAGMNGMDGSAGSSGRDGAPGRPGRVRVHVTSQPRV
jgi:hypothetical protein